MTVANVNVVFGEQEEPMVYHIDDIIIPALTSGIFRESGKKLVFYLMMFRYATFLGNMSYVDYLLKIQFLRYNPSMMMKLG